MVHVGIMKCTNDKYLVNLSIPLLSFNNDDRGVSEILNLIELEINNVHASKSYSTRRQAECGLNELTTRLDLVGIEYEIGDWY